jgi:hypothetical protein
MPILVSKTDEMTHGAAGANSLRRRLGETHPLQWVLLAVALVYLLELAYIVIRRIGYPFELEWLEGVAVDCIQHVLDGQKPYMRPSVDFACVQYPPVYGAVSAAACRILGIGFFPMRLVSCAATMGTLFLIVKIVRRETRRLSWGIVAAGFYAAMFAISGAWFDIARVDALFLLFLVAAVDAYRFLRFSRAKCVLVTVLFLLAFFTKQFGAIVIAALLPYGLVKNRREILIIEIAFGLGALLIIAGLDYYYDGWYSYYTLYLPIQHGVTPVHWLDFWTADLWKPLPFILLLSVGFLVLERGRAEHRGLFYLVVAIGMFLVSWVTRLHAGSFVNALMPCCCTLAILGGVAMPTLLTRAKSLRGWQTTAATVLLYSMCILQFYWLAYNPSKHIPTREDEQAGRHLVALLRSMEGEIYVPCTGFYPTLAGKRSYANLALILDILRGTDQHLKDEIGGQISRALSEKKFAAVVMPSTFRESLDFNAMFNMLKTYGYTKTPEPIFKDNSVFWQVTDIKIRPNSVYVPAPSAPANSNLPYGRRDQQDINSIRKTTDVPPSGP